MYIIFFSDLLLLLYFLYITKLKYINKPKLIFKCINNRDKTAAKIYRIT